MVIHLDYVAFDIVYICTHIKHAHVNMCVYLCIAHIRKIEKKQKFRALKASHSLEFLSELLELLRHTQRVQEST